MPSGGARAHSGPPPDPDALRRDRPSDAGSWVHLSPDGRAGDPPVWPLTKANPRETTIWAEEWRKPQAVMWEAAGQERQVAMYVRSLAEAEKPRAATPLRTLVKQLEETLGLSLSGLARNRWMIDREPQVNTSRPMARSDAKERLLRVVGDG